MTIPSSVTSIGEGAFYGCSGLTELTIPNSVTSIGDYAFYGCSSLTELTIGSSVTSIGDYAFYGCSSLAELTIPSSVTSIGEGAFYGCSGLTELTIPNSVTSIGSSTFYGCSGLSEVTIPNSVTSIGDYAFYGCSSLTELTIGSSVTEIGSSAFYNCSGLKELTVEDGDNELSLGSSIFSGTNLETVYLGRNLSYGSSYTSSPFYNITSLVKVTIGSSVTTIGSSTFYGCSGLSEVTIPNSVTTIGSSTFYGCSSLVELTIPNSVTSIGSSAFYGCSGLAELTIGSSVTEIGSSAFYNCSGLKELTVEDGDNELSLGSSIFSGTNLETVYLGRNLSYGSSSASSPFCNRTSLVKVIIGSSVTEIGDYAFYGCSNLHSVTIGEGVLSIGSSAFSSSPEKVTWLTNTPPEGYRYVGGKYNYVSNEAYSGLDSMKVYPYLSSLFEVGGISYVPVSPSERTCDAIDCTYDSTSVISLGKTVEYMGVEMTLKDIRPYLCYDNKNIKTLQVAGLESGIADYAFSYCSSLEGIDLSNVESIGKYCFSYCPLLSGIDIPSTVNGIGDNAFKGCTSLADVTIADRTTELLLGSNGSNPLFADCPLDSVYIGGNITYPTSSSGGYSPFYRNTSLRALCVADGETEISDNEFYGCTGLSVVVLGDSIGRIGNYAFFGCSSLDSFTFGTGVDSIGAEAFSDCTAMTRLVSHTVTPPTCGSQALDDINKWTCELFVPEESIPDYMAADQWKEFFFISSDIDDTTASTSGDALDRVLEGPLKVYGLSGRLLKELDRASSVSEALSSLGRGVYVLTGNGQTCKVAKGGK